MLVQHSQPLDTTQSSTVTRLCRIPIIQHVSSCFTAHKPEAGRVQGTDLAFLQIKLVYGKRRLWPMSNAVRLLQVLQLSTGGYPALRGAC